MCICVLMILIEWYLLALFSSLPTFHMKNQEGLGTRLVSVDSVHAEQIGVT